MIVIDRKDGQVPEPRTSIPITPEEVAHIVNVEYATVIRWLQTGRLKGTKLGRRTWRIYPEDLQAFIDKGWNTGGAGRYAPQKQAG